MRGYLLKANSKHKWEKRWFVLDNDLLFYYKNPNVSSQIFLTCLVRLILIPLWH